MNTKIFTLLTKNLLDAFNLPKYSHIVIDEDTDLFAQDDWQVIDWSSDDGCSCDHEYINMSEDESERMEVFLEENSVFDLQDQGWYSDDTELYLQCDVTIERIE